MGWGFRDPVPSLSFPGLCSHVPSALTAGARPLPGFSAGGGLVWLGPAGGSTGSPRCFPSGAGTVKPAPPSRLALSFYSARGLLFLTCVSFPFFPLSFPVSSSPCKEHILGGPRKVSETVETQSLWSSERAPMKRPHSMWSCGFPLMYPAPAPRTAYVALEGPPSRARSAVLGPSLPVACSPSLSISLIRYTPTSSRLHLMG